MSSLAEKFVAMSTEVMAATISGLQAERAEMAAKVASLEESLADLAHENALLKRRLFGSKTERLRTSELQLALGDLLATEAKLQAELDASVEKAKDASPTPDPSEGKGKARPHGRRNLFASNLPRVPVEIRDPALEARGARLIRFEDSTQLAFRRGGFFVVVKRVAQYELIEDSVATVIAAAPPETLFPKALLHTSTVAHILTSKFALGVPHYRLERDLLDQGMRLDRGLMSRYAEHAGNTLGATIVAAMWRDAIAHGQMISTDATGALIQPTKAKDGTSLACKKGHFFTAVVDADAVLFAYVERHTSEAVRRCSATFAACSKPTRARSTRSWSAVDRPTPTMASRSSRVGRIIPSRSLSGVGLRAGNPPGTTVEVARAQLGIILGSQRLEETDQLRRRAPRAIGLVVESGAFPERGEDVLLHFEVGGEVTAGCRDADMAQVVPDHRHIDACLEQCDGTTMPKNMGGDPTATETGCGSSGPLYVLCDHVRDAVTGQRGAPRVAEDQFVGAIGVRDERPKRCGGLRPDRADALLLSLAMKPHLPWSFQLKVPATKGESLAHAGPRIVEEEQQRSVTVSRRRGGADLRDHGAHFVGFQVRDQALPRTFRRDREDATVLLCARHVMA